MNYNGSLGTPTLRGTSQLTACQHRQHEPFATFNIILAEKVFLIQMRLVRN